jgi:hypothetical protein
MIQDLKNAFATCLRYAIASSHARFKLRAHAFAHAFTQACIRVDKRKDLLDMPASQLIVRQ